MEKWGYEDDYLCCKYFVEKYVIEKDYSLNYSSFIHNLSLKIKSIPANSIKMKISNTINLLDLLQVKHICKAGKLTSYSTQNLIALKNVLEENNINYDREKYIQLCYSRI